MPELSKRELKKEMLELLREDEEFRYAMIGLLGLEDTRKALSKLARVIGKLATAQAGLEKRMEELAASVTNLAKRVDALAVAHESLTKRMEELAAAHLSLERRVEELAKRVEELTIAQARLEKRMEELATAHLSLERRVEELAKRVEELAAAQLRLEKRMEELAAAHASLERRVEELAKRVDALAVAHESLTKRMEELAAAHASLEKRVEELAVSVLKLTDAVQNLAREVGRLSETVGFGLEDVARVVVPGWLHRHEGIEVEDLVRRFFTVEGEEVEINLYGEGLREGRRVYILGEAKSRIYGDDVWRFYSAASKVAKLLKDGDVYMLMFGFYVHPTAEKAAEKLGVRLIASYMR